ncbi:MAG: potassium channel protein [Acidimicrobiales bacterium]|nr:potassium channel protein [Acidimicrobiales bacterium]RZV46082.1 MAG: potassium channel protein [Acidimicrobiales bacterium]
MKFTRPWRHRYHPSTSEQWRRLQIAVGVLFAALTIGTAGYMALGLNFLDAVYQTVITVSTVGFSEVGEVTRGYRIFTIAMIMVGAGAVLYTVGVLIETLIEGRITQEFGRRRMEKHIGQLQNHIVLCGWGQVGESISATLTEEGQDVVVVDQREEVAEHHLRVIGDATDDAILREAGIDRARSLVVALDTDANNVYVTLSGRATSDNLFIVSRANNAYAEEKLFRAGADRVVNPHKLGASHMAALVTQPNVAEFLDITMNDRELTVSISELTVVASSALSRQPLAEVDLAGNTVLAIRRVDGSFDHHPDMTEPASVGDVLIALGTASELRALHASFDS